MQYITEIRFENGSSYEHIKKVQVVDSETEEKTVVSVDKVISFIADQRGLVYAAQVPPDFTQFKGAKGIDAVLVEVVEVSGTKQLRTAADRLLSLRQF